jgi:hypothetical protein
MEQHRVALDYVNSVLQQRGPTALPYADQSKWTVRDQLLELQKVRGARGDSGGEGLPRALN